MKDLLKRYGRYVGLSIMFASLYAMGVSPQNLAVIAVAVLLLSTFRRKISSFLDEKLSAFEHYSNAHPLVKKAVLIIVVIAVYLIVRQAAYFISSQVFGFDLKSYYTGLFKPTK